MCEAAALILLAFQNDKGLLVEVQHFISRKNVEKSVERRKILVHFYHFSSNFRDLPVGLPALGRIKCTLFERTHLNYRYNLTEFLQ